LTAVQVAVGRLQAAVGLETPDTYVFNHGAMSAQRWLHGARGVDFDDLSASDRLTLQKHHVLDWLISNHDAHSEQFLRTARGIVGIDKDQAFRYFGRDKLAWTFHPNAYYGQQEPVYNALWRDSRRDGPKLADPRTGELGEFINRLQTIPDADVRDLFRPYAEQAARARALTVVGGAQPGLVQQRLRPNDVESFLSAVVQRKNNLAHDFATLYDRAHLPSAQLDPTVVPTNIGGAYAARDGAIYRDADDDGWVYRDDTREPGVI
jgi:hypothetical protein